VQEMLRATGAFTTVDAFNAAGGTPTLLELATYDAILIFGAELISDAVALGDRLAAYHDQGGGVVVAGLANCAAHDEVQGAWKSPANGYAILDYASCTKLDSADSLGNKLEPQSPLLTGVSSLSASPWGNRTSAPIINGGVVVAKWSSGAPLVVRGVRGDRTLVELTMYAAYVPGWTGDGVVLMRNALKYSRCMLSSSSCGPGFYTSGTEWCLDMISFTVSRRCWRSKGKPQKLWGSEDQRGFL
jgi:hypothetical protein